MAFKIPKQTYSGAIGETTVGIGKTAVKLGGQDSYPFHLFEGRMPNPPKIAMEVWDCDPTGEWPVAAIEPFKNVLSSPDAWAKKCVEEYGADMIVLQLKSIDPNGMNKGAEEAAEVAKKVSGAVNVPLVVMGTATTQKDEEVLKKISETCEGKNIALGPVEEGNHKGIGASALGYGHTIVAATPIDVNLAKQLNILLNNLGVKKEKIIIDPTTGGLGYGLEYSYSVMERIMMAALTQDDDKLMMPMMNNVGNEVWKCKEAKLTIEEAPTLGDPEKRGILMETVAAVSYLMAGSSLVILRHPESVRLIRSFIDLMTNGGSAGAVKGISKKLASPEVDLFSLSPKPTLDFGMPQKALKEGVLKPKNETPAPQPKFEKKAEKKPKMEAALKVKEEEDKAKAEAEIKEKAAADAKAESEAKKKAESDAGAKREAEENKIWLRRSEEKEKHAADRGYKKNSKEIPMTPAVEQKNEQEKILERLNRIHRRIP